MRKNVLVLRDDWAGKELVVLGWVPKPDFLNKLSQPETWLTIMKLNWPFKEELG
jgi:hypothetical protein